ncbi:MAG: aminotransferase class III-fold pyridoxal phosphate-dependent enzyme [Candidatus Heimdallarchaeota archaeon]|nr:MAG: aminotransferase class III-fold pyridoxal phosphate-dependent enzyme [Candidatus Heimdallarchaeota archaeon]
MNFYKVELANFIQTRPRSEELWKRSVEKIPGGVSHNIRNLGLPSIGAFPVFVESGHDAYLIDIDGLEYIDYWQGHYSMLLGHNHPVIQQIIKDKLEDGWHFGTVNEGQVKLAETLINDNPSLEEVRFSSSGTESTMYATRLARAYTGKPLIAKAKMGWHGYADTLLYNVKAPFLGKEGPGILPEEQAGIMTFEANNTATKDLIQANAHDLAAVIIEPVLGGGGGFPVALEFLEMIRELTESLDILLIFDEIITGYRFSYGLFQNQLKILPDLTTMGKIVGGGLSIGVVGGRKEIMEQANPQLNNRVWTGGGTFSAHPLSMAAGLKTLEILKKSNQDYTRTNQAGTKFLTEMNEYFTNEKLNFVATGYKSFIALHVLSKYIEDPCPYDIVHSTAKKGEALLQLALLNRHISGMHGIGALSFVHTSQHIRQTQDALEEIALPISKTQFK